MFTEVTTLVRDELLHCCARKKVLASIAAALPQKKKQGRGSRSIGEEHEEEHEQESFLITELVIDHICCLFRLVLLSITRVEAQLDQYRVHSSEHTHQNEPRLTSCAVEAMERGLTRAVEGLLVRPSGYSDMSPLGGRLGPPSLDASSRDLGDLEAQPANEEGLELPTFIFRGDHDCSGGGASSGGGLGGDARALEPPSRFGSVGSPGRAQMDTSWASGAVFAAAQHLQMALGVSTMSHTQDLDVRLVKELLADIMPPPPPRCTPQDGSRTPQ